MNYLTKVNRKVTILEGLLSNDGVVLSPKVWDAFFDYFALHPWKSPYDVYKIARLIQFNDGKTPINNVLQFANEVRDRPLEERLEECFKHKNEFNTLENDKEN